MGGVAVGSAIPQTHDPRIFALGALAVATAGATVVLVSIRRLRTPSSIPERRA
jgi:hypothetical protein